MPNYQHLEIEIAARSLGKHLGQREVLAQKITMEIRKACTHKQASSKGERSVFIERAAASRLEQASVGTPAVLIFTYICLHVQSNKRLGYLNTQLVQHFHNYGHHEFKKCEGALSLPSH